MGKNLFIILALLFFLASIFSCTCVNNKKEKEQAIKDSLERVKSDSIQTVKNMEIEEIIKAMPEEPIFDIVTNVGTISVKLYAKTPKHRENFAKLALSGFYEGILFHRVINGFMIQGGDPNTKDRSEQAAAKYGQGGPGYTIPAEFVKEYTHKKGALAAARRGDMANPKKESSGSQFYIVQDSKTCAQLDGAYTVFGETIEGLDIIDKIANVPTSRTDRPLENIEILKINYREN